jgi:hypothetical protein
LEVGIGTVGDEQTGLILVAEDASGARTQLRCHSGADLWNYVIQYVCGEVPASFDGTSFVLEMILHSETSGEPIYVDDFLVEAFPNDCLTTPISAPDPLSGCNANTDSLDGWTVVQGDLRCMAGWSNCGAEAVPIAAVDTVMLERSFSLSDFDSRLELCVLGGEQGAGDGELIEIGVSTGGGYVSVAGFAADEWGGDGTCVERCVDLFRNGLTPSPGGLVDIAIVMHADDQPIGVGGVSVNGLAHCDAIEAGHVTSTPLQENGDGGYSFSVATETNELLRLSGRCRVRESALEDRFNFVIFP